MDFVSEEFSREIKVESQSEDETVIVKLVDESEDETVVVKLEDESDDEEYQEKEGVDDDTGHVALYSDDGGDEDDDNIESTTYQPPEPSYDKVNTIPFFSLCERLELCWVQQKRQGQDNVKKKKATKAQLFQCLLSKDLKKFIGNDSPYPLLRLIIPDKDSARPHTGMKEKVIAYVWGDALGLADKSPDMLKLKCYTDPDKAGASSGDLSVLIQEVVKKRTIQRSSSNQKGKQKKLSGSKVTIGEMNDLLDNLVSLKTKFWQRRNIQQDTSALEANGSRKQRNFAKFSNLKNSRIDWVKQLIYTKRMSPLEHKWIVRILLQRMEIGLGPDSIISYYHEWAQDIYDANKNLKKLCSTLADPAYIELRRREKEKEVSKIEDHNRANHLPRSSEPAVVGDTLSPMLSAKTSPNSVLFDIRKRHKRYADALDKNDPIRSSLAIKFPVILGEIKMDGERMLIHINKGRVKMHTRNGTWYSEAYSPVLGPALRQSLQPYEVDVILDGEVIAWDNGMQEVIPFGNNRSVAKCRKDWMSSKNMIDRLDDDDLHAADNEINILSQSQGLFINEYSQSQAFPSQMSEENSPSEKEVAEPGEHCWLKFVVFDILYLGGKDAFNVMKSACQFLPEASKPTSIGSILNLDLYIRRLILAKLITPQQHMVEIVATVVIRPDGSQMDGTSYFAPTKESFELGHAPLVLDSINIVLDGSIPFTELDKLRKKGMTDKDIDNKRAQALQSFFSDIVLRQCLEGLIFKDLSTPYVMGAKFRSQGYWLKYKMDYSGRISGDGDIDVIVLGAYFATGMKKSGMLNSFLIGCIDSDKSLGEKFMTICNINGGGVQNELLRNVLKQVTDFDTYKYKKEGDSGKWFKGDMRTLPDFISQRSYQRSGNGDTDGWIFKKEHYPDLWIDPQDSFVLTVYCGEIVSSDFHSSGVSLRFPRINCIRADGFGGGGKHPSEIETVSELQDRFHQRRAAQHRESQYSQQASQLPSQLVEEHHMEYKFLSTIQAENKSKVEKSSRTSSIKTCRLIVPKIGDVAVKSQIFSGYSFLVFGGTFSLEIGSLDWEEAETEGWSSQATLVQSQQDIIDFILSHSGTYTTTSDDADFIIGGRSYDARVMNHLTIVNAAKELSSDGKRLTKQQKRLLDTKGVLKWAFLYRAVHRAMNKKCGPNGAKRLGDTTRGVESEYSESINQKTLLFEHPRRFDYLVLSTLDERLYLRGKEANGIQIFHDTNMIDLKRALNEVGVHNKHTNRNIYSLNKKKRAKVEHKQWQYEAENILGDGGKYLMQGPRQKFWDIGGQSMVLYPDMFNINKEFNPAAGNISIPEHNSAISFLEIETNDFTSGRVLRVLPLAKAMGARVTSQLTYCVTHVLTELLGKEIKSMKWDKNMPQEIYGDLERGSRLNSKLLALHKVSAIDVTLVSPEWIREQW